MRGAVIHHFTKGLSMTFLPDADYDQLVRTATRIAGVAPSLKIQRSPWTGQYEADDVKIALGECMDIWPQRLIPHLDPEDRPATI